MITIAEGKQKLRAEWEKGLHCPCCNQWVRLNPYTCHHSRARVLIILHKATVEYRTDPSGFIHVEDYLVDLGVKIKGVVGKMKYWGLVEAMPNDDPSKKTSGYWRITDKGMQFVNREITVPQKAFVFDDKVYKFSTNEISIVEALGKKFDYSELMQS
jgi:hypothetical protein